MSEVSFVIPGRLRGKGRPRAQIRHRKGGGTFVHVHNDDKTISAEASVKQFAALAMRGLAPFTGPLILDVTINLNRPTSWPKKRKAAEFHATGKPDLDNIAKMLGDACNGIVWGDDSQLCEIRIRRGYNDLIGEQVHVSCFSAAAVGEVTEQQARAA